MAGTGAFTGGLIAVTVTYNRSPIRAVAVVLPLLAAPVHGRRSL
jgi:hypothetical protein